ncbi:MAG: hypothetical protein K1X57_12830 [Gemmataceae bacterium]|nr:hypothetical protein [Gemmataceae bacterium]
MRRLARFLLRWIAPVAAVAAVWVAWWLTAQLPLKVIQTGTVLATRSWSSPALNSESIVYTGAPFNSQVYQRFEVDLKAGRSTPIPVESGRAYRCAPDLSWVAWESSDSEITIADLPGVRTRFRIPLPGGGQPASGLSRIVIAPNSRLIGLYDARDDGWDVWDLQDRKRLIRIVGATPEGKISSDGSRLAARVAKPNVVRVWKIPSGELVGEVPLWGTLDCLSLAPNGRLLIGCVADTNVSPPVVPVAPEALKPVTASPPGVSVPTVGDHPVTFKLLPQDLSRAGTEFRCVFPFLVRFGQRPAQFSGDGRHLLFPFAMVGLLWDTGSDPPRCLDADLGLPIPHDRTARIAFNPTDRTMVLNHQGAFRLIDRTTLQTIVEQKPGPDSAQVQGEFSPDGRWLTSVEQFDPSKLPRWQRQVQSVVRQHTGIDSSQLVTVRDAETGEVLHCVPGSHVVAWPADGSTLWTEDTVRSISQKTMIFRQWPIHAPRPPIWLWAGTALVAAAMLLRLLRALRGRPVAIAGAPR